MVEKKKAGKKLSVKKEAVKDLKVKPGKGGDVKGGGGCSKPRTGCDMASCTPC
jgi:hypothetical protein